jgi:hypothetical protein
MYHGENEFREYNFFNMHKKKPQSQCSPHRRSGFKTQIEILYEQLKKIDNLDFCFYKKKKKKKRNRTENSREDGPHKNTAEYKTNNNKKRNRDTSTHKSAILPESRDAMQCTGAGGDMTKMGDFLFPSPVIVP